MANTAPNQSHQARLERLQERFTQGTNGMMDKIAHLQRVDLSQLQW